jgi:hypothetical protein
MMTTDSKLDTTLQKFDALNQQDPHQEQWQGQSYAKEWLYAQRMTEMLLEYDKDASETLQLAARSQHICRWEIPRSDYPMDRQGYLKWRTQLKLLHAQKAETIMLEQGYDAESIQKVKDLLIKKGLKNDPQTQALEDVICLVFLKYYFAEFAEKHPEDKIIDILQKTWAKMTEKGHQLALQLPLSDQETALVQKALM